jgi:hypothetical protein
MTFNPRVPPGARPLSAEESDNLKMIQLYAEERTKKAEQEEKVIRKNAERQKLEEQRKLSELNPVRVNLAKDIEHIAEVIALGAFQFFSKLTSEEVKTFKCQFTHPSSSFVYTMTITNGTRTEENKKPDLVLEEKDAEIFFKNPLSYLEPCGAKNISFKLKLQDGTVSTFLVNVNFPISAVSIEHKILDKMHDHFNEHLKVKESTPLIKNPPKRSFLARICSCFGSGE